MESSFDEKVFGNFWIVYAQYGEQLSVVNDRGQLILYDGPNSDHLVRILLKDLYGADEKAVLDVVSN